VSFVNIISFVYVLLCLFEFCTALRETSKLLYFSLVLVRFFALSLTVQYTIAFVAAKHPSQCWWLWLPLHCKFQWI